MEMDDYLTAARGIQLMRRKTALIWGSAMGRLGIIVGITVASSFVAAGAMGQITPAQSVVSGSSAAAPVSEPSESTPSEPSTATPSESSPIAPSEPSPSTPSIEIVRATPEPADIAIDPASLLPDLPKLPA